jgi:predicted anti-sigma-YlaC factor YlaD
MSALFNYNETSLLIEKRAELPLSPTERASVWAHLSMCVLCRHYARQTVLVAQLAQRLARPAAAGGPEEALPPTLAQKLDQLIRQAGHSGPAAG